MFFLSTFSWSIARLGLPVVLKEERRVDKEIGGKTEVTVKTKAANKSQIRASTLSGECRFTREFFTRNQWKITEQLQECVRRRATLSLMARPTCKDDVHAARIVNEVWDSCFTDTRPFDEIYR